MRADWHALHARLVSDLHRHGTTSKFKGMQDRHRELRAFPEPVALIDWLHDPSGDPEEKNAVLGALVTEAQAGETEAHLLITVALWPALDGIYRRRLRHFRSEPDLLVSEIHGRLANGVARLDFDRVTRIAATLVMNIERDIVRMLTARSREERARLDVTSDLAERTRRPPSELEVPPGATAYAVEDILADRLRPLIGRDADLIVAVEVRGRSQKEAAEDLGIGHDAARKRHQRAMARLREVFLRNSESGCPNGVPETAFPH